MVELLLKKGANIIVANNNRQMPFYIASVNRYIEIVKLLLEKGADIIIINNNR